MSLDKQDSTTTNNRKWIPRLKRICKTCGKEFEARVVVVKNGGGIFCSKRCSRNNPDITRNRILCKCETCGKEFAVSKSVIRQGQGKHCSMKCRKKAREHDVCLECEKDLSGKKSKSQKFCSADCLGIWRSKHITGDKTSNWNGGKIQRVCTHCGKEFYVFKNKVESGEGKFCSRKCSARHTAKKGSEHTLFSSIYGNCKHCEKPILIPPRKLNNKHGNFCSKECHYKWASENLRGENNPCFKSKIVTCIICGNMFKITPHWEKLGRTKYCSQECYWKDLPNLIGGNKHPNWCGGSKIYCEKWTAEFRNRIRMFFDYTCVECGTKQSGRLFHCHHVYYNKKACCDVDDNGTYISNLGIKYNAPDFNIVGDPNKFVLLCDSCHARSSSKKNRKFYARYFESMINMYYGGKSYFTQEEYKNLVS